ncbi:hypothetical protein GCM10007103_15720 [Salinimicrobium marinum]|uniref:Uncharacterized protein n=1 Tax=Salinimicrobium marinum TaxID=680283 RepID=A0A918SEK3_9FLAO|nr:hypothetical protein [Salinimicrobium marinum]GHA35029.1 hypothetical protein GCM10007103_15720 [Salinimicrobium marinum]
MEKSIEQMWSNGFLKDESLLVPKINDLYNQKSQLLIEKFKRTYSIDNKSMIPLGLAFFAISAFYGYLLLGVYLMLLTLTMFFLNRKKLKELESISIGSSSYEYLLEYRQMIKKTVTFYTRLLGFGLPVMGMIGYYLYFKDTPKFQEFLGQDSGDKVLIVLGIGIMLAIIGVGAYKITTHFVYGRFVRKMEELIRDMKELREE